MVGHCSESKENGETKQCNEDDPGDEQELLRVLDFLQRFEECAVGLPYEGVE